MRLLGLKQSWGGLVPQLRIRWMFAQMDWKSLGEDFSLRLHEICLGGGQSPKSSGRVSGLIGSQFVVVVVVVVAKPWQS